MIASEILNGGRRIRRWSDRGMMLRKLETGRLYEDAADVIPCRFRYEETEIPIPDPEEEEEEAE